MQSVNNPNCLMSIHNGLPFAREQVSEVVVIYCNEGIALKVFKNDDLTLIHQKVLTHRFTLVASKNI